MTLSWLTCQCKSCNEANVVSFKSYLFFPNLGSALIFSDLVSCPLVME